MEHFKVNGIWENADVYQFYNVEEAKQHKTLDNNYPRIVKEFEQLLGKSWVDEFNNYWQIIGLEDNQAWDDYYWIIKFGETIKFLLVNDSRIYKQIV